MRAQWLARRIWRRDRLALTVLRLALGVSFSAMGLGFFEPRVVSYLAQAGVGPTFRVLFGFLHVAVGLALMVSRLAATATIVPCLLVVAFTALCLPEAKDGSTGLPAVLTLALVLLAISGLLRRRDAATVWRDMLDRYADDGCRDCSPHAWR